MYDTIKTSTASNREFNAIHRTGIAYTDSEICGIILRGVFCSHKPYFLMLGHICYCTYIDKLCLGKMLWNSKVYKSDQILCAHKPYFLMMGHVYLLIRASG